MISTVVAVAALATFATATPIVKRADAINDTVVLNYALTLEHLEKYVYVYDTEVHDKI